MSPTVFRSSGFRFSFYSREELRMHVHVHGSSGEAKFWIEPAIELAQNWGLSKVELALVKKLVEDHEHDIRNAWKQHFNR